MNLTTKGLQSCTFTCATPRTGKRSMELEHTPNPWNGSKRNATDHQPLHRPRRPAHHRARQPAKAGAVDHGHPEKRVEHILKLKPELCSLDIGSSMPASASSSTPRSSSTGWRIDQTGRREAGDLKSSTAGTSRSQPAHQAGSGGENAHFQLCMGTKMGVPATPRDAVYLSESLPPGPPGRSSAWARPTSHGGHGRPPGRTCPGRPRRQCLPEERTAGQNNAELVQHTGKLSGTFIRNPRRLKRPGRFSACPDRQRALAMGGYRKPRTVSCLF